MRVRPSDIPLHPAGVAFLCAPKKPGHFPVLSSGMEVETAKPALASFRKAAGVLSSNCQMRTTVQPCLRRTRFCRRSRALLPSIFFRHQTVRVLGIRALVGCPCQNSPSMKIAIFFFPNIKSGRTKHEEPRTTNRNRRLRLHPLIFSDRNRLIAASSVSQLPCPRIRDMTSLRLARVKTSGICDVNRFEYFPTQRQRPFVECNIPCIHSLVPRTRFNKLCPRKLVNRFQRPIL